MEEPFESLEPTDEPRNLLTRDRHVSFLKKPHELLVQFSPFERMLLYTFSALLGLSTLILLAFLNIEASVMTPTRGGEINVGVVGTPRFINPLLAISQVDQDITTLTYSGLMRRSGSILIPDLAESYTISQEGTVYAFTLRKDATFHDGEPVTAEDILFTVSLAQNPDSKSTRRADWEGVTASSTDPYTVVFTLPHAYAPFLENTQLGILPKHLWKDVPVEEFAFHPLNTHPVGTGPFEMSRLVASRTGTPENVILSPFESFTLGEPFLERIIFTFFGNDDALRDAYNLGLIDTLEGVSPEFVSQLDKNPRIEERPSTRIFAIFLNQNRSPVLSDPAAREALNSAIDREELVRTVLSGYGTPLESPIPPGFLQGIVSVPTHIEDRPGTARALLEKGGWTWSEEEGAWMKNKQKLTFSLATTDTPELAESAQAVADMWRTIGVSVQVEVYPISDFNAVLRPRQYDAILFGEVVGRTLDLFAFWHSSQRNDPGLNLALYTNTKADRLLAAARSETDARSRESTYREFEELITKERPALFLYAPVFLTILPEKIRGVGVETLSHPSERFTDAHHWYFDTETIWTFFNNRH